jgi:hypothetical protein
MQRAGLRVIASTPPVGYLCNASPKPSDIKVQVLENLFSDQKL